MSQFPSGQQKTISIYRREYSQMLEFLQNKRKERGLTQAELGMLIGQDQTFVSKYENQVRRLDIVETLDICKALGISMCDLLKAIR
jgi:transcriptional regulator with XRE-family HTH domain